MGNSNDMIYGHDNDPCSQFPLLHLYFHTYSSFCLRLKRLFEQLIHSFLAYDVQNPIKNHQKLRNLGKLGMITIRAAIRTTFIRFRRQFDVKYRYFQKEHVVHKIQNSSSVCYLFTHCV